MKIWSLQKFNRWMGTKCVQAHTNVPLLTSIRLERTMCRPSGSSPANWNRTHSSLRPAGFRTICSCVYILVVIQRSKFSQRTVDMCHFAFSYTSTESDIEKIQPAYALIHSIMWCVGGLNFLYIRFG